MKTAMEQALARIEMLYIEKDSVHWEMFKNDCVEKEKEQIIYFTNEWFKDYLEGLDNYKTPEEYYNQTYNQDK